MKRSGPVAAAAAGVAWLRQRVAALVDDLHGSLTGAAGAMADARSAAPLADEPDVAAAVMRDVLKQLAVELNGRRIVVWRVDRERAVVVPEHVLGTEPKAGQAAGNPLTWTVEEGSAMRVDPAPAWAQGAVVAAPVDERRAFTVETRPGEAPEPAELLRGAATLRAVLRLVDREVDARAERERLRRVTGFLQGLSRDHAPDRVPESLARAAIDLVGGRGAVVASWDDDGGVVLARVGAEGPEPGTPFGPGDADLAHAARTGAAVRRGPTDAGERPPLAGGTETWSRIVAYRVAVPLLDPAGEVGALVGIWGDAEPADRGVAFLEAMGPLLTLHFRQASDLVRFRHRATVDALTGLPNRAAFDHRLAEEQTRFHRYRRPTALMVIDLDHFKRVNDTHGHEAGDTILEAVARVVRETVRDADLPARYGGEELVVLMPETMAHAAGEVAERVRHAIASAAIEHHGVAIPITASIGVSACPQLAEEPAGLFESADQALYQAKEEGRDRVVVGERG